MLAKIVPPCSFVFVRNTPPILNIFCYPSLEHILAVTLGKLHMKLFDDIVSKMNIGKKYHMIIQYTDCKSQRLIFYDKISTLETFQNHLGLN